MAGLAPTRYRYDVFLSHSSADKPVVRELAEQLRAAGLRVWFDEWVIKPGDPISVKIEEGLEHSAVLLFCMSANAIGSDWVRLEHHAAIFRDPQNLERRFVPLRLDDVKPKAMLRIFAEVDWRPGADRELEWGRLLEACGVEKGERPGEQGPAAAGAPAAGAAWEPPPRGPAQPRQASGLDPEPADPPPPTEAAQPARAPAKLNDDERDEWRETADRLFLAACQAISGDMNEATAKDSALAAVRKAAK
jgi:hypothetical protein